MVIMSINIFHCFPKKKPTTMELKFSLFLPWMLVGFTAKCDVDPHDCEGKWWREEVELNESIPCDNNEAPIQPNQIIR